MYGCLNEHYMYLCEKYKYKVKQNKILEEHELHENKSQTTAASDG